MINLNTIKNAIIFYYHSDITINCLLIHFSLIFKVNLDNFLKIQVFKVDINIFLKYIGSMLIIVFVR